jgi:hypothetical protein
MTKTIMNSILSLVATINTPEAEEIRVAIQNELSKGEAKAQANRDLYAQAHDVVIGALTETPVTIGELYEEVKDSLPEGFSKGKVQYAVTRLWADEVVKTEGKVNTYSLRA